MCEGEEGMKERRRGRDGGRVIPWVNNIMGDGLKIQ